MVERVAEVPKGEMWMLLGDKAIPFALWLNQPDNPNSVAVKTIFDSLTDVDLTSNVFQGVLQILLSEGVITQVEIDACNARASKLHELPAFADDPDS